MSSETILKEAHERFTLAQDHWNNYFIKVEELLRFIDGDQWDSQLKRNRENLGLPCLTSNQLPTFLRQITNEARQNCPSIQISPKSDGTDQTDAEILADLIRGIEQSSGAATAYDNASWYAAATGLGFFRVVSEYESDDSFLQKLVIKPIQDPLTVLMDPNHKALDGSDMEYCFVLTTMSKDDYKRAYPNSKLAGDDVTYSWSASNKWQTEKTVLIAEYYWKEYTPATLYQILDVVTQQVFETTKKPDKDSLQFNIVNQRAIEKCEVRWAKLNDVEILEETTWPGQTIPVISVKGDETWIQNERKLKGAVADAVDSQRVYNYNYSVMAESIAMAPKAPWVLTAKQIENHEHLWRDANNSTLAYLTYNSDPTAPPPTRNAVEPAVQAAIGAMHEAADSMKSVFGLFNAAVGQQGSGTEGFRTVLARQESSHTTTYHFYDNLAKAVEQAGCILVECIPTFYADERSVQLVKQNGQASNMTINSADGRSLVDGSYGVVVETGPSYATRRQDSVDHMLTFSASYPQIQLGDIIADESDWPGAKRIADRIRLMLPPEIQQAEATSGQGDPKVQVQQLVGQVKDLTGKLQMALQHIQQTDQLVKQQHEELTLNKLKSDVQLEKSQKDFEIKKDQLTLDELEAELSYKVKLKELALQDRQIKLEEAKVALVGVEVMSDLNDKVHDKTVKHHERMLSISTANPTDDNMGKNGPEGIDKSFETLSGENIS